MEGCNFLSLRNLELEGLRPVLEEQESITW